MSRNVFFKKFLFLMLILAAINTAGCVTQPKPDAVTGHFPTDTRLSGKNITRAQPVNLKRYKMLVIRGSASRSAYTEYSAAPDYRYLVSAITALNIFDRVVSINSLISPLVKQEQNDEFLNNDLQTEFGLRKLTKIYGDFLVLNIEVKAGWTSEIVFNVFDPVDSKVYFSGGYSTSQQFVAGFYNPMLNAFIDWARQN